MAAIQFTDEQFREFHAEQLTKQTVFPEHIRNYVAIWFWVTVVAGFILLLVTMQAAQDAGTSF
jgi:hypothetical protein